MNTSTLDLGLLDYRYIIYYKNHVKMALIRFFWLFIYMSGFTGLNIKKYLHSSPKVGL